VNFKLYPNQHDVIYSLYLSDKFYRILELDYDDIEYYSPEIIDESDMDDIDENFVKDLVNQYLKENDLPSETIL